MKQIKQKDEKVIQVAPNGSQVFFLTNFGRIFTSYIKEELIDGEIKTSEVTVEIKPIILTANKENENND